MDEKRLTHYIARALPLFFSLPFAIVSLAVAFGPSAVDAMPYRGMARSLPFIATTMVAVGYAAFAFALSRKGFVAFLAASSSACAALAVISTIMGMTIHRDFLAASFQYAFIFPIILVLHARFAHRANGEKGAVKQLARTGYIVSAFYLEWIMLMGYAIATRAEPRPIESLIYNLYNLALTLVLFFASRALGRTGTNSIQVSRERMTLGEKDITSLAGIKRTRLLHAFVTADGRRLRCPDIQRILYGAGDVGRGEHGSDAECSGPDCARCDPESAKAAQCGRYRSTYNSILELKKLMEFLEIGTIVTGENRRHVLEDGWRFVTFEGSRIRVER